MAKNNVSKSRAGKKKAGKASARSRSAKSSTAKKSKATKKKSTANKKSATKPVKKTAAKKKVAKKRSSKKTKVAGKKKAPVKKASAKKKSTSTAKKKSAAKQKPKKVVKKSAVKKKSTAKKKATKKAAAKKKAVAEKVEESAPPAPRKLKVRKRPPVKLPIDRKKDELNGIGKDHPIIIKKTPFNKSKLAMFRKLLLAERDRHVEDIAFLSRSARNNSGDLSNYSKHMADQGTDNFRQELNLTLASNEHDIVWEIDEAIKRIDNKTFGVCEITGKTIGLERLKAMPYTRHSIEAQEAIERGHIKHRPLGSTLKH